jgi:hypothetical protein
MLTPPTVLCGGRAGQIIRSGASLGRAASGLSAYAAVWSAGKAGSRRAGYAAGQTADALAQAEVITLSFLMQLLMVVITEQS